MIKTHTCCHEHNTDKSADSVLVLLRASESGIRGHHQVLSGVRVNTDGSEVVWRSQPRVRSSISRYMLEAGSARLARKMDTYITSNTAEFPKPLARQNTAKLIHVRTCMYLLLLKIRVLIRLVAAATIRERRLFRSALAQVRLLFESGVYSRVVSTWSYTVHENCEQRFPTRPHPPWPRWMVRAYDRYAIEVTIKEVEIVNY